jgi:hypothetical protein
MVDTQNFDFNINKIYETYIKNIDSVRSEKNIINIKNTELIKDDTVKFNLLKIENSYQESRCHAFFRFIGFPITDGTNFYNPGWDPVFYKNKNITVKYKLNIASKASSEFNKKSNQREKNSLDFLKIFSRRDFNSSLLSLSSILKLRKFELADDQSYKADLSAKSGDINNKLLTDFIGPPGDIAPDIKMLQNTRYHIIYPFQVDARYDLTVNKNKQFRVPFLSSYELNSQTISYKKPLLENIITERLNIISDKSSKLEEIKNYINNAQDIKNSALIQQVNNNNLTITEQSQFLIFLNYIRGMLETLLQAQKDVKDVQQKYYWLPIPSAQGPEFGCEVRNIFLSERASNLFTNKDKEIVYFTCKNILLNQSNNIKQEVALEQLGIESAFDLSKTDANGNKCGKGLSGLLDDRSKAMVKANNALKTIEIIMGEFSGLGLCDILAIIGSLYILPKKNLLGLLDAVAFERMKNVLSNFAEEKEEDLFVSLDILSKTVKNFYILMDKLYDDLRNKNKNIFNS